MKFQLVQFQVPTPLHSLALQGNWAEDWLGGYRYALPDGTAERRHIGSRYRWDSVAACEDMAVVYEAGGTHGMLLQDNGNRPSENFVPLGVNHLRELHRSYYHAEDYDYPVLLFRDFTGRMLLAHCPEEYCRLDFDDALTGAKLTQREEKAKDVFHSRLEASLDGRWVLGLSWVWHPWNVVTLYNVERALKDPNYLSNTEDMLQLPGDFEDGEPIAATFVGDQIVVAVQESPAQLLVLSLETRALLRTVILEENPGTVLMAAGEKHVVALDEVPRVFSLETGRVVHRFTEVPGAVSRPAPSVNLVKPQSPHVARDPRNARFGVTAENQVWIVQLEV